MNTSQRLLCIALLAVLCTAFAFATSDRNLPTLENTQTILNFEVRFSMNNKETNPTTQSILSTWSPLETLSANDFQLTSSVAPTAETLDTFYPFGKQMFFSFDIAQALNTNMPTSVGEDSSAVEHFEFNLQTDETVMPNILENPTFLQLNEDKSTLQYSKHTNFKGTRMNAQGQIDTLLVAVMVNTDAAVEEGKKKLETQSEQQHKTLATSDFVVEAILLAADGKIYQISTYNTLLFQMQQQVEQQQTLSTAMAMQQIDVLSNTIALLQTQAESSPTGLSISELKIDGLGGKCGTSSGHVHEDDNQEENALNKEDQQEEEEKQEEKSLAMKTLWSLSPWDNCHGRFDKQTMVVFTIYHNILYRKLMSDTVNVNSINNAKVGARTKLIVSMMNVITAAQFKVVFAVKAFIEGDGSASWDPINLNACGVKEVTGGYLLNTNIESMQSGLSTLRERVADADKAAFAHALVGCYPEGTVGLAHLNAMCRDGAAAVSSVNGLGAMFTVLHENFHIVGADHVFGNNDRIQGTRGSIMDYNNIRLADNEPVEGDRRQYGFSKVWSWDNICTGFTNTWKKSGNNGKCWQEVKTDPISTTKTYEEQVCNRDGIVDAHEECDAGQSDNKCCKGCKFAEWATCSDPTDECCEDCIAAKSEKRCKLGSDTGSTRSGMCFRGKCMPDLLGCARPDLGAVLTCPDEDYQYFQDQISTCQFACPLDGCGARGQYALSGAFAFETGAFCRTANGKWGVCLGVTEFDNTQDIRFMRCQPFGAGEFSWRYTVLQACNCQLTTGGNLIDSYVCLDPSGYPVSSVYCADIPKPERKICPSCSSDTTPTFPEPFAIVDANNQPIVPQDKPSPAGSTADGQGSGYNNAIIPSAGMMMISVFIVAIVTLMF